MTPRMRQVLAIAGMCAAIFGARPAFAQRAQPAHTHDAAANGAAPTAEGVVNINTATQEELQRIPGIGPSRATAIVALRQRVQHFRSADDLLRVRGIGHAGMRRMRPYVSLSGETTLTARPGRPARARGSAAAAGTTSQATN